MIKPIHLLVSSVILFLGSVFILYASRTETESKLFCAYGRLFVEFHEGHVVWGTIMLDDSGMPVLCPKEETNKLYNRGIVL